MTTTKRKKPDSLDKRYEAQLQVAAMPQQWLAVRRAIETALAKSSKDDRRYWVLTPFLGKLDAALKSFRAPKIGQPGHGIGMCETNIPVTGSVIGWILVAEWILTFGCEEAKVVGAIIVPACSQVVFSSSKSQEGDESCPR